MTYSHDCDPAVGKSAFGMSVAVAVIIVVALSKLLQGHQLSGQINSALAVGGLGAVALSSWALWKLGKRLNRGTLAAVTLLASTGLFAVSLVNLELLGQTGFIVTVPFLVPILLALFKLKR